jgi:hypothetical protein
MAAKGKSPTSVATKKAVFALRLQDLGNAEIGERVNLDDCEGRKGPGRSDHFAPGWAARNGEENSERRVGTRDA